MEAILKQISLPLALMAGSAVIIFILVTATPQDTTTLSDTGNDLPVERISGPAEATVILTEYSDFECPACAAYEPMVRQIRKEFEGKIRFVYRYFPLSQIHPKARLTSQAAQAAALQGKFWEMHDLLFDEQQVWVESGDTEKLISDYATRLGLNLEKFNRDLNSDAVMDEVSADYDRGVAIGIQGTPTFFLNGKSIKNPRTYDEFGALIQASLDN